MLNKYFENVEKIIKYEDFKKYVDAGENLCELKSLHYQAGNVPDYSEVHIQQYYILRYAYAYAFEYKNMFLDLFTENQYCDNIKVTSLGCGNAIDYWSLVEALKTSGQENCIIVYRGIDYIDWNYKVGARIEDEFWIEQGNVADELKECDVLTSDVYFFPKSISEFTENDFQVICKCFSDKPIEKNNVHIMISLRSDEWSMDRDMHRSEKLVDAMQKNGYVTMEDPRVYRRFRNLQDGIRRIDREFMYPNCALELLKNLQAQCGEYPSEDTECGDECGKHLNRQPIMKVGNICYQILSFIREEY